MATQNIQKNHVDNCQPDNAQIAELKDRMMAFRKKNFINRAELARMMGLSAETLAAFEKKNIAGVKTIRAFLVVESSYRLVRGKLVKVVNEETERDSACRLR